MRIRTAICLLLSTVAIEGCITISQNNSKSEKKNASFRQVNFQDLINRYMKKDGSNTIEGVYSVSGTVIKKGKNLVGTPKEKTTDRKENYATVAILREKEGGKDYIELSLNKEDQTSYSIIGEFKEATTGSILVYKHFAAKGKDTSFTFTRDEKGDILEGVRVDHEGNTEVTYKLTYVKLAPK